MLNYSEEQLDEIICLANCRVSSLLNKRAIDSTFSTSSISIQDIKRIHLARLVEKFKRYRLTKNYTICVQALTKII